jgi:starch phosphorylase
MSTPGTGWQERLRLPEPLAQLAEIAGNFWWSWTPAAMALFERVDPGLWERSHHNPVKVLLHAPADTLQRLAHDRAFLAEMERIRAAMAAELDTPVRFNAASGSPEAVPTGFKAAYFCAEFGLAECLQIYCGGLGLLAGDHLKSASQLGLPLVGVGLLYSHGYFHQSIDRDGLQHELTPGLQPDEQPIQRVIDPGTGEQRRVWIDLPGRSVAIGIWRGEVGRVPLYLLDTNLPENSHEDRDITRNLYLGDHAQRIKQELVLGVGGVRALAAVGEQATIFHMNEGHAAFLALERIRALREASGAAGSRLTFDQVREAAAAAHVFTTHTPLPAGIDRFHPELVKTYLAWMLPGLGLDSEGLLALGRERVEDREEFFSMAVLAIRTSRFANGVSRLHGAVSRAMWRKIWPGTPVQDVPIGHVTNGVHTATWVSPELAEVYDSALGTRWRSHPDDEAAWAAIERVPDETLWRARQEGKRRLIEFARTRLRAQRAAHGENPDRICEAEECLNESVLTIGFARRFAPYKRATLLFHEPERLLRLLRGERPIQVLIAGKAHPGDTGGRAFIRQILEFTRRAGVGDRVVFLEDYDIHVARRLVQGVDIWLNNPIRGLEASGTSGMKAALNGAINVSILDGWWDEAFDESLGFAIGGRETTPDSDAAVRDETESRALYALLEDRILPEYYARTGAGGSGAVSDSGRLPRAWLARVKRTIRSLAPRFSTHRMVAEYARAYYLPAHRAWQRLAAHGLSQGRALSDQVDRWRRCWPGVQVVDARVVEAGTDRLTIAARVQLAGLAPDEVQVQAYLESPVGLDHEPVGGRGSATVSLDHAADLSAGLHRFEGSIRPSAEWLAQLSSIRVRVLPKDPRLVTPFIPGLVVSAPVAAGAAAIESGAAGA